MLKVVLPVDGSESALRATEELIKTLSWYKECPAVDLVAVHLPVPGVPNRRLVVSDEALERYYAEETEAMVAASKKALDAAGVTYTVHQLVGSIAESIVDHARRSDCSLIFMGTRGMTALSNMVMGSVATKVLHLAKIPVMLIH